MRRALLLILLAACSDDGGTDQPVDAPATPDAGYDTARCLITGNYGDLGAKTGSTTLGPSTLSITLDPGPPRDSFSIRLVGGMGVFAAGLANGTYPIAGTDAQLNTCGLCVSIVADITMNGPSKFYMASAGSVTLTSTTPPAGTLQNVQLREITAGGTEVAGGCTASIMAMSFSSM